MPWERTASDLNADVLHARRMLNNAEIELENADLAGDTDAVERWDAAVDRWTEELSYLTRRRDQLGG